MNQDVLLTPEGDFQIDNGDFMVGDATYQLQEDLLIAHKGEYKLAPEIGVGIMDELLNENPRALLGQIKRNFEYDGMTVHGIKIAPEGNLLIDAEYKAR